MQSVGRGFDQRHRNPGIGEADGDAAAHGAGADDRGGAYLLDRQTLGQSRRLGGVALGVEDVAQGAELAAVPPRLENLALARQALVEGQGRGRDRRNRVQGRLVAAFRLFQLVAFFLEQRRAGSRHRAVAAAPGRPVLVQHALGESGGGLAEIARRQLVDQPGGQRGLGVDHVAARNHVEGEFRADESRQALGPAAAGDEAELDLGQAQPRLLGCDAPMAAQGELQPAAQRGAVDGGDGGLGAALERGGERPGHRLDARLVQFGYVGAGDEGAPGAGEHDRLDGGVGQSRVETLLQRRAHRPAQGVNRRVVKDKDGDAAAALGFNQHGGSL